ncbi:hypothetical protein FACS1894219_04090 [Clostridia bacterium]|nr:hypothetical protein FACS1894219_04090 [Clostridia bacterium]
MNYDEELPDFDKLSELIELQSDADDIDEDEAYIVKMPKEDMFKVLELTKNKYPELFDALVKGIIQYYKPDSDD